ncbi:hypothetical protein FIBSPDRAFT_721640 [Athelia psychrophila]|uniref:ABM domain-containing protein n=1 Tax=Athelia psychrophila TaxID=1759441 RepID=A0A166VXH6_9AGAM|nr:hypothetical protein FIBSPDRAFT_721640 [Fibularhizoctonia sp. CBS 109695]
MAIPSTEIVIFPTAQGFRSDPSSLANGLEALSKADGLLNTYAGLQNNDQHMGYMINNWKTHEHFERLASGPEYPHVLAGLKASIDGHVVIHHVDFVSDITKALNKPLTEIVFATVASAEAKQELFAAVEQLSLGTDRVATYGSVIGRDNLIVFVAGWESKDVRFVYPCYGG